MLTITTAALSAAKPRATMMSLYKDQPGKIKKTQKAYLKCIFLCKTHNTNLKLFVLKFRKRRKNDTEDKLALLCNFLEPSMLSNSFVPRPALTVFPIVISNLTVVVVIVCLFVCSPK